MIAVFALAGIIQVGPQVDLKQVWKVTADQIGHAVLIRRQGTHEFRYLRRSVSEDSPDARDYCNLDAEGGTVHTLATVRNIHKGTEQAPDDLEYSLTSNGELQTMHWDGVVRKWSLPEHDNTIDFIEGLNHYWEPTHEVYAEKYILPPFLVRIKNVGDVHVLNDGAARRIAFVGGEVRSYIPQTWRFKQTLIVKEDLFTPYRRFMSPKLVGDPQSGPFAISNGDRGAAATAFFDQDMRRLDVAKDGWCYDANRDGFLIAPHHEDDSKGSLQCIDSRTGAEKWLRTNYEARDGVVEWVGNHVVAITGQAADTRGELHKILTVLDGESGATVYTKLVPPTFSIWQPSGIDNMILITDDAGNYYGYRIEMQ